MKIDNSSKVYWNILKNLRCGALFGLVVSLDGIYLYVNMEL